MSFLDLGVTLNEINTGAVPFVNTWYLLQENGYKILLEDGASLLIEH